MSNASKFLVVETATPGLYQVVNTGTGLRTVPMTLVRCRRILVGLLR